MDTLLKNIVLRIVIMTIWLTTVKSKKLDVCFWKTYELTCDHNEVIQMKHALYGRMSVGLCIPKEAGYDMGCQVDILGHLDSVCSGRRSCQLRLPQDDIATAHQPCTRGLEAYLQLEYNCISVLASPSPCAGIPLPVTQTHGLLSNFITEETGQGSKECPWEVRGSSGQKIRLTLYDYGLWNPPTRNGVDSGVSEEGIPPSERSDICRIYARLTEDRTEGSVTLCGGEAREKIVYLSETDGVSITLTAPKHSQQSPYFLLRYEIVGCHTYTPPKGAVIVRHVNNISVKCPNTGSGWNVVCDGSRWKTEGNVTNCTEVKQIPVRTDENKLAPHGSTEALLEGGLNLSQGLVIAFFLSIAVLIAVIITVVGIVVLRRRQSTLIESTLAYNSKEHFPMLTKDQRQQQSLRERSYTSTAQRHAGVPLGTVTPQGQFPPLPLPPTPLFEEGDHCTIHGTLSQDRYPGGSNQTTQRFSSSNDWPNSLRRPRSDKTKNHFYHELDPEHTNVHTRPAPNKEFEIGEFGVEAHVSPLPDVLA